MTERSSSGMIGVGGEGADPLLGVSPVSAAASASLPQDSQAIAHELVQRLTAARLGTSGSPLTVGPQPAKPIMPQSPMKISPEGAIPQGPFASVGERKRADTQAAFNSIAKIVQTAQDRHYQAKVQKLQHDFETLSGAIQGYKEAQQSGNSDMMKHNADIINNIVSDPSKAKELSKAFDVNMNPMAGGDKKGKEKPNPAHDAMKAAFAQDMKNFQGGKDMLSPQANAMMRGMPQTLQTDPRFVAYQEAVKSGVLPSSKDELQFRSKVMEVQERIQNNELTNATKLQMSENLGKAMMDRTRMQEYGRILGIQLQQLSAADRTEALIGAYKYRADQTLKGVQETNKVRAQKLASGDTESKKLSVLMKGLDDSANSLYKQMEEARKRHDVPAMQALAAQSQVLSAQMGMANARAASLIPNLDPEEFQTRQPEDPGVRALWDEIFKSAEPIPSPTASTN